MLKNWKENLTYLSRSYTSVDMHNILGWHLKNVPEAAKDAILVKFFNVQKPMPIMVFKIMILNFCNHIAACVFSLREADIIIST